MHAFLFTGGSAANLQEALTSAVNAYKIPPYDQRVLVPEDKTSVGIAQTRMFIQQLSLAPTSDYGIAGIIPDMGTLTQESQQALLKTIEEPPPHVQLFLGAQSESVVLPTIVSRCQRIAVHTTSGTWSPEDLETCTVTLKKLVTSKNGDRIAIIQTICPTKDDAKRFIGLAIEAYERQLLQLASTAQTSELVAIATRLHALLDAKKFAAVNVHPVQLLERIFLEKPV